MSIHSEPEHSKTVAKRVRKATEEPKDGAPVSERDAAASDAATSGMSKEDFAALRHDIRRMWSPEPEETR